MKLNLGSGDVRNREGYTTLDANPEMHPDIVARVPPIPLPDESVGRIFCSHLLEHLISEEASDLIADMWRVLKVGGEAEIIVPYGLSHEGIQDPTHKSLWCYSRFLYYSAHFAHLGYGFETRWLFKDLRQTSEEARAILVKTAEQEPCNCFDCSREKF